MADREEVIRQAIEDWLGEQVLIKIWPSSVKELAEYIAKRLEHEPRSLE
jgi:Arc/MetJ-type ribon-helix-helix transcriptional regulator